MRASVEIDEALLKEVMAISGCWLFRQRMKVVLNHLQFHISVYTVYQKSSFSKDYGGVLSFGDPGGIQTPDLQNRNLTFYSAELRGQDI